MRAFLTCALVVVFLVVGSQAYAATNNNGLAICIGIGFSAGVALLGRWWLARSRRLQAEEPTLANVSPHPEVRPTFAVPLPAPAYIVPRDGRDGTPTRPLSQTPYRAVARPASTLASSVTRGHHDRRLIVDRAASAARAAQLDAYLASQVLTARGEFVCSSAPACKSSAQRAGTSFLEAQGHSVGPCYDLATAEGIPMRILIVPMESGGSNPEYQHITIARRTRDIEARAVQTFPERNPHMKGVTLALRLAFGLPVNDADAEHLQFTDGTSARLLSCYAMTNLLLCSAVDTGTMQSRQTAVMRTNCSRHLVAAVKILQPTLVISQGAKLESTLRASFGVTETLNSNLAECDLQGNRFVWAQLHHPTRNWSALTHPYLHEVVAPTIKQARLRALAIGETMSNFRSTHR